MLNWGVIQCWPTPSSADDMLKLLNMHGLKRNRALQSGDDIVIVAGVPLGEAVRTNNAYPYSTLLRQFDLKALLDLVES